MTTNPFLYASVFLVSVAWLPITTAQPVAADQDDSILQLDAQYRHESSVRARSDNNSESARDFYERWLAAFREAWEANPDSPNAKKAASRVTELLNGLGRYPESLEVLKQRLHMGYSRQYQLDLLGQIGVVAKNAFIVEKDINYARESIDALERVLKERKDGARMFTLHEMAQVNALGFENYAEAARLCEQACDLWVKASDSELNPYEPEERSLRLTGCLWSLARYQAKAGQHAAALATLTTYLQQDEHTHSPGAQLSHFLTHFVRESDAFSDYERMALNWARIHAADEGARGVIKRVAWLRWASDRDGAMTLYEEYEALVPTPPSSEHERRRLQTTLKDMLGYYSVNGMNGSAARVRARLQRLSEAGPE